jgi:DNA-binding transcriptional regulator YiaG
MPNIASLLKAEIARVARKQVRTEIEGLRSASTQYRTAIAALKKRVQALERELAQVRRGRSAAPAAARDEEAGAGPRLRFRSGGFASLRRKLGISAADTAKLLNVTAQTVYAWEAGRTRPRQSQLQAIAELRKLGKREVQRRLAAQ